MCVTITHISDWKRRWYWDGLFVCAFQMAIGHIGRKAKTEQETACLSTHNGAHINVWCVMDLIYNLLGATPQFVFMFIALRSEYTTRTTNHHHFSIGRRNTLYTNEYTLLRILKIHFSFNSIHLQQQYINIVLFFLLCVSMVQVAGSERLSGRANC